MNDGATMSKIMAQVPGVEFDMGCYWYDADICVGGSPLKHSTALAYKQDGKWYLTPAGAFLVQIAFKLHYLVWNEGSGKWESSPNGKWFMSSEDPAEAVLQAACAVVERD